LFSLFLSFVVFFPLDFVFLVVVGDTSFYISLTSLF